MGMVKAQLFDAQLALMSVGVPEYLAATLAWGMDKNGNVLPDKDYADACRTAMMHMGVPKAPKRARKP